MEIGIVGFGHLGKSLAKGLIKSNIAVASDIYILTRSSETKDVASKQYGFNIVNNINEMIDKVNIIFWVIKSNALAQVCSELNVGMEGLTNISFMAGMSLEMIKKELGNAEILRAMPSIAIENADGIIAYTSTNDKRIPFIFNKLGYAFEVEEKDIEKVTAFAACGLGFASYILNAFHETGKELGFSEEISEKIVARTFSNAILMSNFKETAKSVATKGGATEQGILCFENNNLNEIIKEAINKAYDWVR